MKSKILLCIGFAAISLYAQNDSANVAPPQVAVDAATMNPPQLKMDSVSAPPQVVEESASQKALVENTVSTETNIAKVEQTSEVSVEKTIEPAIEPQQVQAVAQKKADKFDKLHGASYNTVGNEAAADNIDDYLDRPDLFENSKFLYLEPAGERGVVSFGSFFGSLDISGELGRAALGYANNGFGLALVFSLGQLFIDSDAGETSYTEEGDQIGFTASYNLGKYAVIANGTWTTFENEKNTSVKYEDSYSEDKFNIIGTLAVSNAPGAKKVYWTGGVGILRHVNRVEIADEEINVDKNTFFEINPFFNIGTAGLKSERARVLVGLNTNIPITLYDDYKVTDESEDDTEGSLTEFALVLSPNIMGEVSVNNYLSLFGEASYDWFAFRYGSGSEDDTNDYKTMASISRKVNATIGLRLDYDDMLACEFAFGDSFFTDTKSIFNGEGTFVSFGAFLYF